MLLISQTDPFLTNTCRRLFMLRTHALEKSIHNIQTPQRLIIDLNVEGLNKNCMPQVQELSFTNSKVPGEMHSSGSSLFAKVLV